MKEFIRDMKAVSDPTRVKILKVLEKRMMCVCELQTALGAAQSTTSKHLKILEDEWTAVTRDGSLSAQFEQTILVTENGFESLTPYEL